MDEDRRAAALEAADPVSPPTRRGMAPAGKETAILVAAGAALGAVAGPIGAVVGAGVGLAADAIRRRLLR